MGRQSLARRRDFRHALRTGRRARRDGLTVWAVVRSDEGPARLGLTVGRAAGNAVTRNRVKRRIRAAFVDAQAAAGVDVVVRADGSVAGRNFQDMERDLTEALAAVGAR